MVHENKQDFLTTLKFLSIKSAVAGTLANLHEGVVPSTLVLACLGMFVDKEAPEGTSASPT